MSALPYSLRDAQPEDAAAIHAVVLAAFGQDDEAQLVTRLNADGEVVHALVAEVDGVIVGHILFSRLWIENKGGQTPAVALAPLSVHPDFQGKGLGRALIEAAHDDLKDDDEDLSIVLGDRAYYGRFGYDAYRASMFESAYAGPYLLAEDFTERAIWTGKLVYPRAFAAMEGE